VQDDANKNKSLIVRVRDQCDAPRPMDVDLVQNVFDAMIMPTGIGRIVVTWRWLRDDETPGASYFSGYVSVVGFCLSFTGSLFLCSALDVHNNWTEITRIAHARTSNVMLWVNA
jgi:hypothetical protein